MKDRPLGHNPWFRPVKTRASDETPNPDDEDQAALRAFGRKLDQQMFDADYGGLLLLTSKKSMSWLLSFPRWSNLTNEGLGLRLKTKMSAPDGLVNARAAIGFIGDVRDLTFEIHGFFAQFFKQVTREMEKKGNTVEHPKRGTPGHMGPVSAAKAQRKEQESRDAGVRFDPEHCVTAATLRSMGVQIDPAIPDAAWVENNMIRRTGEPTDPDMKLQVWAPFRWVEDMDREEDPPLLDVIRPVEVPDAGDNTGPVEIPHAEATSTVEVDGSGDMTSSDGGGDAPSEG